MFGLYPSQLFFGLKNINIFLISRGLLLFRHNQLFYEYNFEFRLKLFFFKQMFLYEFEINFHQNFAFKHAKSPRLSIALRGEVLEKFALRQ